ncbi:MAG TPA: YetF domain-containing protein [Acidimicrobiia bacterium]
MDIVIRATVVFWFLWLMVRGTGKRSLAELTPLDLILVVVIGDIVQQGINQEDMSITGAVLGVAVFVGWTLVGNYLNRRFPATTRLLAGEPVIILRDGQPLADRLRRERLTVDDLKEAARMQGIADLGKVEFAVLESDGQLSFIEKR